MGWTALCPGCSPTRQAQQGLLVLGHIIMPRKREDSSSFSVFFRFIWQALWKQWEKWRGGRERIDGTCSLYRYLRVANYSPSYAVCKRWSCAGVCCQQKSKTLFCWQHTTYSRGRSEWVLSDSHFDLAGPCHYCCYQPLSLLYRRDLISAITERPRTRVTTLVLQTSWSWNCGNWRRWL